MLFEEFYFFNALLDVRFDLCCLVLVEIFVGLKLDYLLLLFSIEVVFPDIKDSRNESDNKPEGQSL